MYCIFSFNAIYFLKFIVHQTDSEMVKFGMVKLTGRENVNVMWASVGCCWSASEWEGERKLMWHDREGERVSPTTETNLRYCTADLGPRPHYLQRPTRSGAAQVRVLIGCVFVWVVTEFETYHIYKAILQTINIVAQTLSRVLELVAKNNISTKPYWT
jgi:hypothetical protein